MKNRDYSLDIIRIFGMFLIIFFHVVSVFAFQTPILSTSANATWGLIGTTIFFLLSGYLLKEHHSDLKNVFKFYGKRWLSIFPAFYLSFLLFYLLNVIQNGQFLYKGHPKTFLFTLLGIDKYLVWYGIDSYALVGEWFTAILIVLYLLFPLLNLIAKNKIVKWIFTVLLLGLYVVNIYVITGKTGKIPDISVITGVSVFWAGMMISDCKEFLRKHFFIGIITGVLALVCLIVPLKGHYLMKGNFIGLLVFLTFLILLKNAKGGKALTYISTLTYEMYLIHHIFADYAFTVYKKGIVPLPVILFIYVACLFLGSFLLHIATKGLIKGIGKLFSRKKSE